MKRKKRRLRTGKRARRNRRLVILTGLAAVAALVFVVVMIATLIINMRKPGEELASEPVLEASLEEQETRQVEYVHPSILKDIVEAGKSVSRALSERPATVEMTPENTAEFAKIDNCSIGEGGKVEIAVKSEGIPKSDDKYYYLFEQATYDDEFSPELEPISKRRYIFFRRS